MVQTLKSRLDGHFVACSALAAAAAIGGVAQNSDAAIVYSGAVNINIPTSTSGVYVNVVTGANATSPSGAPGWDLNPWSSTTLSFFNPAAPSGGVYVLTGTNVANLPAGTTIDGGSTYGSGSAATTGAQPFVLNSSNNLVGFRFQNEAAGNQTQYGWMRISLAATLNGQPRAIVEYAYEDTGAGIGAGVVPAPGSLALLALGAAGLVGRRRK
jgi:hypothetical protein